MQKEHPYSEFETGDEKTIFRYPQWSDLDAFIEMHQTLKREKVMARRLDMDRTSGGRYLAEILVNLEEGRQSYLLVERGGQLVGEGFTKKNGHRYFSIGLALVSDARGIGIGTKLMWALEKESKRLGATGLYLSVWSENPSAVHVYEKVGYKEIGRRPDWVLMDSGEECDLIEMVKRIE